MLEKTGLDTARWLEDTFADLVAEHGVPGATVAVLAGGQVVTAAGGVTSLRTNVAVDADTVFQIGSITKIWTATLVMQLVDDGLLDLDQPLRDHLPELVIGDAEAATVLTTRHLLTHTAGFEGDIFTDTGRGDDASSSTSPRWASCPSSSLRGTCSPTTTPPSSSSVASWRCSGDKPFDELLVEHISQPLGLTNVAPARTRRSCTAPPSGTCRPRPARRPRRPPGRWLAPTRRRARCSR